MILAIVFVLALVYDLYTDQKTIKAGGKVRHAWSALLRTVGLCIGAYVEFGLSWTAAISVVGLTVCYWFVFDFMLNLLMGWPLFYNGTTSTIDRIIRRLPDEVELIAKLGILIGIMIGYAFTKKKEYNPYDKERNL